MSVFVVVEGETDEPVARKLAAEAGLDVLHVYVANGKGNLDQQLRGYNEAARQAPWFVLRDLDHDATCAPDYLRSKKFISSKWMTFRLAVRQIEAWILADHAALASFLRVPSTKIPVAPDDEFDAKRALVNLARLSTTKAIRQGLVPRLGDSTTVGPEYEAALVEFAEQYWSAERAANRSPSLLRARTALGRLAAHWDQHLGHK